MNRNTGWDPEDEELDEPEGEPEGAAAEEEPDDPEAEIERRAAARAEQLAAQMAQERINEFKGNYGRRFGRVIEQLKARGEVVDEEGNVGVTDPAKLLQSVTGLLPGQKPGAAEEDPEPDPVYDPQGYRDWTRRQLKREVEAAVKPLQQALEQTRGLAAQPLLSGVASQAAEALQGYGLGDVTEHPQFTQIITQAMRQSGIPEEQWGDPEAVEMVALSMVPHLRKGLAGSGSGAN
ncbi:MAG TPA: hypothetical protein VFU47_08300, partial [Armatimonadota bacterium]|nr:hypothetical protein [Armatimonadota bacterium]